MKIKKILLIDNYDSFTYNLYQMIGSLLEKHKIPFQLDVIRNDALDINQIKKQDVDAIVISPGPGHPASEAYFGVCNQVIKTFETTPILGVCLGMQGIALAYGASLSVGDAVCHGKTSLVHHTKEGLFKDLPTPLSCMRYHSIVVEDLPEGFSKTAYSTEDGTDIIMGISHQTRPLHGLQFHPESFATEGGEKMLETFLCL